MSGLAGVAWQDGRVAVADDARILLARLGHRRGRPRITAANSVAMGCLCEQDADDPEIHVMIDGHLHNGHELVRELDLDRNATDRAIIHAAWNRWGRDCPSRLIGDFAFTIHAGDRVFAARDCAPGRALFYRSTPRACYWATELGPLVQFDQPPINEAMVAEYLADRIVTVHETLFTGIYRLPPGHTLEICRDGQTKVRRYWHPDPRAEIHYADQRDYDEHFRMLFREAVRARLCNARRTTLWYSGGIDSSAIAVALSRLGHHDPAIARRVETTSIAVPGYDVDETPYFTAGARHLQLRNESRPFYFAATEDFDAAARLWCDVPPVPSMMGARRGWELLAAIGVDTALTGLGGDDWMVGSQFALIDDIRSFRWSTALARWRAERVAPFGFSAAQLLRVGVWQQLPATVRCGVRRTFGWKAAPSHVAGSFAARVGLDDRLRQEHATPSYKNVARRNLYRSATSASVVTTLELYSRMAAQWHVDARHPFEDRRLVEFALALPADQLLRPGVPRYLVLSAMLHDLPRAIYNRVEGVDYSDVIRDVLRRIDVQRAVGSAIAELPDWFDSSRLREMASRMANADPAQSAREMWALWQVFAIHRWWKAVQHQPSAPTLEPAEDSYHAPLGQR